MSKGAKTKEEALAYSGVALLRLALVLGEEDELGSIFFQTLHVLLKALHGLVPSSEVDGDTDGRCFTFADAGHLSNKINKYRYIILLQY